MLFCSEPNSPQHRAEADGVSGQVAWPQATLETPPLLPWTIRMLHPRRWRPSRDQKPAALRHSDLTVLAIPTSKSLPTPQILMWPKWKEVLHREHLQEERGVLQRESPIAPLALSDPPPGDPKSKELQTSLQKPGKSPTAEGL